jgi:hypothetical protein
MIWLHYHINGPPAPALAPSPPPKPQSHPTHTLPKMLLRVPVSTPPPLSPREEVPYTHRKHAIMMVSHNMELSMGQQAFHQVCVCGVGARGTGSVWEVTSISAAMSPPERGLERDPLKFCNVKIESKGRRHAVMMVCHTTWRSARDNRPPHQVCMRVRGTEFGVLHCTAAAAAWIHLSPVQFAELNNGIQDANLLCHRAKHPFYLSNNLHQHTHPVPMV